MEEQKNISGYSSRFGLLCVLIGSSVGAGNIWRYPRMAALNGGGAFVVAMLICLVCVGIPVLYVENFLGRATRHGSTGAFRDVLGKKFAWMGTWGSMCNLLMTSMYVVATAWICRYLGMSLTRSYWGVEDKDALFHSVSNGDPITIVIFLVLIFLLYFAIQSQKILEAVAKVMLPTLFVILVVIAVYACTRDGGVLGMEYLFHIEWSDFASPNTWLNALTQTAWSLGPGMLTFLNTAIFNSKSDDIVLNTKCQGFGDLTCGMLGGLCVLPCIFAFMPTEEALAACESGNASLLFVGLGSLFEKIPGGFIISILFFVALAFAAFSSILTMAMVGVCTLMDMGMSRKKGVLTICIFYAVVGFPSVMSLTVANNQDTVWGVGFVITMVFLSFVVHKVGAEKIRTQFVNPVSDSKTSKFFNFCMLYLVPILIIIMFAWWCIQAISWYPDTWWNPFQESSLGSMLLQWGILIILCFAFNNFLCKKISPSVYDGEDYPPVPERYL